MNNIYLDCGSKISLQKLLFDNKVNKKLTLIVGCHNALSAFLAQEAGAHALWASGYEFSASMRLPDANILTMSECLSISRSFTDRVTIPTIADCDNGFGNAINSIRTAVEYQRAEFSGICIEDNVFPKRCSFYESKERHLENIDTFVGKIKAVKDVIRERQHDNNFFLIARTETLIVDNNNINEAIDRLLAYDKAGADGLLLHTKAKNNKDLESFFAVANEIKKESKKYLFCVPTTYNWVTYEQLYGLGFDAIILANYGIRSCVKAMQDTFSKILNGESLSKGNDNVVPMKEIFRIVSTEDLRENESRYVL